MDTLPHETGGRYLCRRLLREEAGSIRGIVLFMALLAVATLIVLDVVAVYSVRGAVQDDVGRAAHLAVADYMSHADDTSARQQAVAYLAAHDMRLVDFQLRTMGGVVTCTVTGRGTAKTIVLKHIARLPKVGGWIKRRLHPEATAATL